MLKTLFFVRVFVMPVRHVDRHLAHSGDVWVVAIRGFLFLCHRDRRVVLHAEVIVQTALVQMTHRAMKMILLGLGMNYHPAVVKAVTLAALIEQR
jgi:hypothetical protein